MIAVGVCAGPSDRFERVAAPGIARSLPGATVHVLRGQTSIFEAYNTILDSTPADADALVLIHDDVELADVDLTRKIRGVFAHDDVAIAGVIGWQRPRWAAWTSGDSIIGHAIDYCGPNGERRILRGISTAGNVDTVDGLFLALSPWAKRELRCDDRRYSGFDGDDADICAQVRHRGKRVVVLPVALEHHATDGGDHRVLAGSGFTRANLIWKAKWRSDAPGWRRIAWPVRARFLPLEYKIRRIEWR